MYINRYAYLQRLPVSIKNVNPPGQLAHILGKEKTDQFVLERTFWKEMCESRLKIESSSLT